MKIQYFEKLLYLDRDFISSMYENEKDVSPDTIISKTESIKAGVKAFLFSGGASASEIKSYKISTIGMLEKLEEAIKTYSEFEASDFKLGSPSSICWVDGNLTIDHVERTRETKTIALLGKPQNKGNGDKKEKLGEESYFAIYGIDSKFALVPTEEYWVSGVSSFQELIKNVIGPIDIPVRALLRVYAAHTRFDQWMSVPLIIVEK